MNNNESIETTPKATWEAPAVEVISIHALTEAAVGSGSDGDMCYES